MCVFFLTTATRDLNVTTKRRIEYCFRRPLKSMNTREKERERERDRDSVFPTYDFASPRAPIGKAHGLRGD